MRCLWDYENMHKDRNSANRHKQLCHNVKLNTGIGINKIDENAIEECNVEILSLTSDFKVNELEREVNEMNFASDANLEDHQFKFFIKHLDNDMAKKTLIQCHKTPILAK